MHTYQCGLLQLTSNPICTNTLCLQSSSAAAAVLICNPVTKWNGYASNGGSTGSTIIVKQNILKQRRRRRKGLVFAGFGFIPDRAGVGIDRQANALLKEAAKLLVYQDILKKPTAKAFLDLMDAFRKRAHDHTILRAYGVFFKQMTSYRHSSWKDYVLDSILAGDGSPFARAAANVGNTRSIWSTGIPKSLRLAAASDLESLQKLSIADSTLSGWVADIVSDLNSDWIGATSNIGFRNEGQAYSFFPEKEVRHFNGGPDISIKHTAEDFEIQKERMNKTFREDDIIEIDREMWRKKIGGLQRWSEAVPLLEDYYATHSYGWKASVPVFQWQQDKLIQSKMCSSQHKSVCDFSHQRTHLESLQKNFRRHASRSPAQHVLLCGPSGVGKTQLLRAAVYNFALKAELRVVLFPSNELKTLHQLLEDLVQYWQLRFVILIDDLNLKDGDEHISLLKSALDTSSEDWPSNIILCGTSTHSLQPEKENGSLTRLRRTFGIVIPFKYLSLEEYLMCVEELLDCRRKLLPSMAVNMDDVSNRAQEWVESQNIYTVQDASQFVNSILQFH